MQSPEIIAYLKTYCGWSAGVRAVLAKYNLRLHREGHYPKPGVPLGDGNQKRAAAFALR